MAQLWRYPVKSMQGERVDSIRLTESGLEGDRAWAVVDEETGKVASAKHPRKWAALMLCSARWRDGGGVLITLPDGSPVNEGVEADRALSALLGRQVRLRPRGSGPSDYEGFWPDLPGLAPEAFIDSTRTGSEEDGSVLGLSLSGAVPGSFLDVAALHILTTASLARLEVLSPQVEIDVRRFRPNVLVEWPPDPAGEEQGFPEDDWAGRRITLGTAEAAGMIPTMRCIMTTLAQPAAPGAGGPGRALPARPELLRVLAREHRLRIGNGDWACLGLYASVERAGLVSVGDRLALAD